MESYSQKQLKLIDDSIINQSIRDAKHILAYSDYMLAFQTMNLHEYLDDDGNGPKANRVNCDIEKYLHHRLNVINDIWTDADNEYDKYGENAIFQADMIILLQLTKANPFNKIERMLRSIPSNKGKGDFL